MVLHCGCRVVCLIGFLGGVTIIIILLIPGTSYYSKHYMWHIPLIPTLVNAKVINFLGI